MALVRVKILALPAFLTVLLLVPGTWAIETVSFASTGMHCAPRVQGPFPSEPPVTPPISFPPSLPITPTPPITEPPVTPPFNPDELCGTSQFGTVTSGGECAPTECELAVSVSASGWASAVADLQLSARVRLDDGAETGACKRNAFAASSVSCAETVTIALPLLASECRSFGILTELLVDEVEAGPASVGLSSDTGKQFALCRDESGIPHLFLLGEADGGAPSLGLFVVVGAALAGLGLVRRRSGAG